MEFSLIGALVAGLVATVVMSAMMKMASLAGMTQMPPMTLVSGAMFSGDEATAARIGFVVHYLMMGTVVFGLAYAAIFTAVGSAGILAGLLIGLTHGLIVGVAMAMMPIMHPRMGDVPVPAGGHNLVRDAGEVHLPAPGLFGVRWGAMTPAGLLMGHALYGVVLAVVYGLFV